MMQHILMHADADLLDVVDMVGILAWLGLLLLSRNLTVVMLFAAAGWVAVATGRSAACWYSVTILAAGCSVCAAQGRGYPYL